MARPKPDFPPVEAIRALADGEGRLTLRVTPGARVESVELGDRLVQIKVRAKPEGGKANDAVIDLLAQALGPIAAGTAARGNRPGQASPDQLSAIRRAMKARTSAQIAGSHNA